MKDNVLAFVAAKPKRGWITPYGLVTPHGSDETFTKSWLDKGYEKAVQEACSTAVEVHVIGASVTFLPNKGRFLCLCFDEGESELKRFLEDRKVTFKEFSDEKLSEFLSTRKAV